MRKLICLLLVFPAGALAGQDNLRQAVVARRVPLASAAPLTVSESNRTRAGDPAALCETAVASAESSGRLPARLLHAISLTESGRADPNTGLIRAWPWTINAEGAGQFFETRQKAIAAVQVLQARGVHSIDVGCTQVNLMFHPDAFASLQDAFDPRSNAVYAARFLNLLYTATKDWAHAIGAYHSETPALGDAYRAVVMSRWQNPDLKRVARAPGAYQDFAPGEQSYGAFSPMGRAYGSFASPPQR
jgi:hypothetical protein